MPFFELRNAHRWSPLIWKALGVDLFNGPGLDRLWQSIETLPEWQQAPLVLTFDTGVIPFQAFDWAADHEFVERLQPAYPGHLQAAAALFRTHPEVPLIGVWGTSVTENPFDPWDEEADEPGSGIPLAPGHMYVLERHRHMVLPAHSTRV